MMIDIKELQNLDTAANQKYKEYKLRKKSFNKTVDIFCKLTEDCIRNKAGIC